MWSDLDPPPYREMLLNDGSVTWSDGDVPLEQRGIQAEWLVHFVWSIVGASRRAMDEYRRARQQEDFALRWGIDVPSSSKPSPPFKTDDYTTRQLVSEYIVPLTRSLRAPLYALVPHEARGAPTRFISHAWDNPVFQGRLGKGTLEILKEDSSLHNEYVWIDIACYNQHTFEEVASDMKSVIGSIGKVTFSVTWTTLFDRIWCLWEFLCTNGHVTGASCEFAVPVLPSTASYVLAKTFIDSFTGVEDARATVPEDHSQVLQAIIETFGSAKAADSELRHALDRGLRGWLH